MIDKIKKIGSIIRSSGADRFKYFGDCIRQASAGDDRGWIVHQYDVDLKKGTITRIDGVFEDDSIWELATDSIFTISSAASFYICGPICKIDQEKKTKIKGSFCRNTNNIEEDGLDSVVNNTTNKMRISKDDHPTLYKYLSIILENETELTERVRSLKYGECIDILIDGKPWFRADGVLDELESILFSQLTTPSKHDPNYHIIWNSVIDSHKLFQPKDGKHINMCPENDPEKSYISLPITGKDDFLNLWYGNFYYQKCGRKAIGEVTICFIPYSENLKLEHIIRFMEKGRRDNVVEKTSEDEERVKKDLSSKDGSSWDDLWVDVTETFDDPQIMFDVVVRIKITGKRTSDALTFSNVSRSRIMKVSKAMEKVKESLAPFLTEKSRLIIKKSSFLNLVDGPMFKMGKSFSYSKRFHTAWVSELIEGQSIRSGRDTAMNVFIQNSLKYLRSNESHSEKLKNITSGFISTYLINNMTTQNAGSTKSAELGRAVGAFFWTSDKQRQNLTSYVNSIEGYMDIHAKSLKSVHDFISSFIERMKRNSYHEDNWVGFHQSINKIYGLIDEMRSSGSKYDKNEFVYGFIQEKYVEGMKRREEAKKAKENDAK